MKKIIVTSALPYANGSIHIGHLVEYIQTDIFVRFLGLSGKDVVYCCADDTHGAPIDIKAAAEGIRPKELIARYYKEHQEDFASYQIRFDSYYSTNSEENRFFADKIFLRLVERGLIYEKELELTYCEHDKRFLPDRYVKGKCPNCKALDQYGDVCEKCNKAYSTIDLIDPYCIICKNRPIRKMSKHFFYKLSSLSNVIENWLVTNKNLQSEVRNQILNWVKNGLDDWCISRDGPYFGFRIPNSDKYYYVWLDAPIGYISSLANYLGSVEEAEKVWNDSEIIHFIGKDIIYFHLLFWPSVLKSASFNTPSNIVVHGFLNVNGEKMSKSRGTFLTAKDFLKLSKPDFLRYYYASNLTRSMTDINLDLNDFREKINNELVANICNLIYRTLSFANKNFDSKLCKFDDLDFEKQIIAKTVSIESKYNQFEIRDALREILALSSIANKYFQDKEPWKEIKEDKIQAQKDISACAFAIKLVSQYLMPILPEFCLKVQEQLNYKNTADCFDTSIFPEGHKIGNAQIIFSKIDEINILQSPFSKLNLKVAKVVSVDDHPKAEKLYVLQLDLGNEKRQLVAGLKPYLSKEELTGKNLIIISNLKHANLRGVMSQGMLLAAQVGDKVVPLVAPGTDPGSSVFIDGVENPNNAIIDIEDFKTITLTTKNKKVVFEDKILKTKKEEITIDLPDGATIR